MKQVLLALAVLFVLTSGIYAQSTVEKELQALDQKIEIAHEKNDTAALNKLTDPDGFMTFGNPPRLMTKEAMAQRIAARQAGTMGKAVESDVQTKVYGNTAVRTASFKRVDKTAEGKERILEGRNTRVYVKVNGNWKLVATHGSPKVEVK
jgi:ketosteroid isomerase-like protein